MVESKTIGSRIAKIVIAVILAILALSCLYPLWYSLCLSFSDKTAASSGAVTFWPVNFTTRAYQ